MGMLKPGKVQQYLAPTKANLCYPPQAGDYRYFEPPRFRGNSGFSFCNALWAADASLLAYGRNAETRMTEAEFKAILEAAGFETMETIGDFFVANADMARGFFAANDDFAFLAFRGTEPDDPFDVLDDADLLLVRQEALGGPGAGSVHQGFQAYLRDVWTRVAGPVAAYRATHPAQEICITGHSLGAALATLAFQQLRDEHSSLYTFGCPRAGDQEFCVDVSALAKTRGCFRFVDNQDVVTHVPTPSFLLPYAHPNCALLWIDPAGAIIENPAYPPGDCRDFTELGLDFLRGEIVDPLPEPLADHSLVRYCYWIGKRCLDSATVPTAPPPTSPPTPASPSS